MNRIFWFVLLILMGTNINRLSAQTDIDKKIENLVLQKEKSLLILKKTLSKAVYDSVKMKKMLIMSRENNYPKGEIFANNMLGRIYRIHTDYPKAIDYHNRAYLLAKKINDTISQIYSLNMLGVVYRRTDAVKSALEYHNKALNMTRNLKSIDDEILENIAISHNSIGNIYALLQKEDLAQKHFEKALEIEKKFNNKVGLAINYQNLGMVVKQKGNMDEALKYFNKSLSYNEEAGSKLGKIICNNSIGNIYLDKNKPEKALQIIQPNLKLAQEVGDNYYLSEVNINLAKVYIKLQEYEKAKELLNNSLKIATDKNIPSHAAQAYQLLSTIYEKNGDYSKALEYHKKFNEEENKVLNEKNRQLVSDIIIKQIKLENKEKIEELGEENELVKKKLVQTKKSFRITLLLSLALFALGLVYYKQRQLNNRQKVLNMEQDLLRARMNPHFIFNSLNSIKMYIIQNKPKDAVSYLSTFAKLIRNILESSADKEISLKEEIETIKMYVKVENTRFSNQIDFKLNVSDKLDLDKIKIPPLLTQPFIENALWHGLSPKKGEKKLTINIYPKDDNYLVIEIIDNGIGRKRAMEIKKSRTFKRKSIGIELSKERLKHFSKKHNQTYKINFIDLFDENHKPNGTKVVIEIPM